MSHFAGVSSPMQGSEISAVSTPTVRSRKRAPSEAASKPLIYHWCRFEEEYHPYKQEHVQSLLSIFYRCDIQTADHHHLTPTQKEYLIRPGHDRLYPVEITKLNKAFLLKHHEPFRRLAEAVLLASMKECGWDMWEAYAARMKYGQEGYYRNKEYPSWSQDVSSEASVVSQIRVPDDVLYRTIAALFGFFGLDMPPSTPGDREEARQLIRKARKARRAYQIADGRGDTLSDPGSDEETYMEVDTRDPYYIPKPILRGTRRDCFVYVRCLAYHHVLDNLAKNVGRWAGKQAEAANQALGIEKELRLAEGCLKPPRRPRNDGSQDSDAVYSQEEYDSNDRKEKLAEFKKNLEALNKAVIQYAKADSIVNPHMPEPTQSFLKRCAALHEMAGKYDRYLQVESQGNPQLLKALQSYRKTEFYIPDSERRTVVEHENDMQEDAPMPEDVDDFMTLRDCQDGDSQEKETMPLGMFLYGFDDKHTPYILAGLEADEWPGINTHDSLAGSRKAPIPISLRQHCSDGAVEIVARAYQHKSRAQDPTNKIKPNLDTDYSSGAIIADATGMGKTAQAMQIIGLVAHFAITFRFADYEEEAHNQLPAIMLADRQALRSAMEDDRDSLGNDYNPTTSIQSYMSSIQDLGEGAFGTFAHTGKTAPPCLPSIIVAPPAVIAHWKAEMSRFAGDTLVVVHITDQRSASKSLEYVREVQSEWEDEVESSDALPDVLAPAHLVVLVSTNLLSRMWKTRKDHEDKNGERKLDIFDLDYSVMIIDEVHMAKAKNQLQTACHNLAKKCSLRIGQSATPLVNSPLDVCIIANALNLPQAADVANRKPFIPSSPSQKPTIPNFFQKARYSLAAQRDLTRWSMTKAMEDFYTVTENPDGSRPTSYLSAPISKAHDMTELADSVPEKLLVDKEYERDASDVFALFGPYLMRRSKFALTSSGKRMLPLGKLTQKTINVELREDEVEDINQYLEELCERRRAKLGDDRAFIDRLGYFGPAYAATKSATIAPSYFVRGLPTNLDEAEEHKTPSKIQALIDLIKLLMKWDEDNNTPLEKRFKFVIHCDSREVEPAVLYELHARGMSARVFDGTTSEAERRRIEAEVNSDDDHESTQFDKLIPPSKTRILFCTPVAGLGINLWRTNVVINLTMPWSLATYEQRTGRHHRTPPDPSRAPLDVTVYTIIAINSVDIVMYTATALKSRLDITTFRHPETRELYGLLAPVKDKGAKVVVKHPHQVPNLPRYRRPVDLLAIDYQKNKELLTNTTQFEIFQHLHIISTLRHLHLSNTTLDSLIINVAKTVADALEESTTEEEPIQDLSEDLANIVNLGYIPLEMAENEETPKPKEVFRAHLAAAVTFGRESIGFVRNDAVLTEERLDEAPQSHREWEVSFAESLTRMKEIQTRRLRDYEDRVWKLIRSIPLPIRDHLGDFESQIEMLRVEGNRMARTMTLIENVPDIPVSFDDCVYWIQRALVNDSLYPNDETGPPSSGDVPIHIDTPPEKTLERQPSTHASQSDESSTTGRPSEPSTEIRSPSRATIYGNSQTALLPNWAYGNLDLNPIESSRANHFRPFLGSFQGPGKIQPLSSYAVSSIQPDLSAEELRGTPSLSDDQGSDDDDQPAQWDIAKLPNRLASARNLILPPGVPPIDPIKIAKNRMLNKRREFIKTFTKPNPKRSRSPSPERPLKLRKGGMVESQDLAQLTLAVEQDLEDDEFDQIFGKWDDDSLSRFVDELDDQPKKTASSKITEAANPARVLSTPQSLARGNVSSSKTNKAANPTRVLSTPQSLKWDDELDAALDEIGAGDGYVVGHRFKDVIGFEPMLEYLVYDSGETPDEARWVDEDTGRTYPVQVYFKAIQDDQEDRFERLDYTLPEVRDTWNEDGTRVRR